MDFEAILERRRAVNVFDPVRDVQQDMLEKMIKDAANTPSSYNLQPWNVIVLRELDDKMRLRKLAMNQPKVSEAPVVLIVLADCGGWQAGHPTVERNFEEMVQAGNIGQDKHEWYHEACQRMYGGSRDTQLAFGVKNTAFFAMSLMYAATNLGLDTHPMDGFLHDAVKEEFHIPDRYWIPLLMSVGYFSPDETLAPKKWRKGYDDIVVRFD